jgi:hypothetical protein
MGDLSVSVLTLILLSAGAAAAAQGLPPELRRCMAEKADAARLACFDREAARLESGAAPAAAATTASGAAAAAAASAPPLTPEQRFGLRGEVARETLEREKAAKQELEKLEARVTAVATGPTGDWVVTLDNGQVWGQVPSGTRYTIRVGDAVTIAPAALGSYMLTGESGRSVRVRRRR